MSATLSPMEIIARATVSGGREMKVFDWVKAATLIVERMPREASAGLSGDWGWTGGTIWRDGAPVDEYTFLASTWATPELDLDGDVVPCFRMQSEVPSWNSGTKWPDEAMAIIRNRAQGAGATS